MERRQDLVNKKCIALTEEQYKESIALLRSGFDLDGVSVRANPRIATIEVLQACLGLRLGDVLKLKMSSFIKDGNRWRLDIVEQKTKKVRNFTVPVEVYSFIQQYAIDSNIGKDVKLFDISERQVERQLSKVFSKMNLPLKSYSSHSYRKYFATQVYVNNDFNIQLVQTLLQHSSVQTTQRYLSIGSKQIEDALAMTAASIV